MKTALRPSLALAAALVCAAPPTHAAPVARPAPPRKLHGPPHTVYVSPGYDGRTITLPYGQCLEVCVSQPDSPDQWHFVADPKTPLRPVEDAEYALPSSGRPAQTPERLKMVGGNRTEISLFTVTKPAARRRTCLLTCDIGGRGPRFRHYYERWQITVVIPRTKGATTP